MDSTLATTAPHSPDMVVRLSGLTLAYRGERQTVTAVQSLDLDVPRGEFVSILGPSGCGKSTVLRVVVGLLAPTAGRVLVNGEQVAGPRADVGMVFQQPTLLPWRTVRQNIEVPARALGLSRREMAERTQSLIALVRLDGFADAYPHELSGGMQQRVGLARALMHDPDVLLMDEPFAALDALTRERMALELLKLWTARRKTVIFVTHSTAEAAFLSDRVVVFSQRPARIAADMRIDLPRPRTLHTMGTPEFAATSERLRAALFAASGDLPDGAYEA